MSRRSWRDGGDATVDDWPTIAEVAASGRLTPFEVSELARHCLEATKQMLDELTPIPPVMVIDLCVLRDGKIAYLDQTFSDGASAMLARINRSN